MRDFYAKILLFGEYSVVVGSSALSVPYLRYSGRLDFETNRSSWDMAESGRSIREWLKYMLTVDSSGASGLDLKAIGEDVSKGLYFNSDIPQKYGMGSSGALIAAIFDRYSKFRVGNNISSEEIKELKSILALSESFFHGTSSGFDPLSVMAGRPIIYQNGNFVFPDIRYVDAFLSGFYLIDTGKPSSTGEFVNGFLKKIGTGKMKTVFKESYLPAVEEAIRISTKNDGSDLGRVFPVISRFQYEYMREMIPPEIQTIWERGLKSGDYYMKLCGSGGGGFMLVWSPVRVPEIEKSFGPRVLPVR